ncbi:MAG: hypothetical protein JOY93_12945 [Acidobacteriales bacterium]|nr:hypothetical protein [Terriglobales bacterium]
MKLPRILLLAWLSAISAVGGPPKTAFHGEISDTQCALKIFSLHGTHTEMLVKQTMGTDAASCAKECVRRGGQWVLRSGDVVYRLRNSSGLQRFAGQQVKVAGTLDAETNTIDNDSVRPEPEVKMMRYQKL